MRGAAVVVGLAVFVIGCGGGFHKRGVTDASADFKRITGFDLPKSAKLVAADDTHLEGDGPALGPGVLDGRIFLIFDADIEALKKWLSGPAPWGTEWREGPVPDEIAVDLLFRRDNEHLWTLVETRTIRFAAHARGSGGTSWHDGELIVIDPDRGRVWLFSWDT